MRAAKKFWKQLPLLPLSWLAQTAPAPSDTFFAGIAKPLPATHSSGYLVLYSATKALSQNLLFIIVFKQISMKSYCLSGYHINISSFIV